MDRSGPVYATVALVWIPEDEGKTTDVGPDDITVFEHG